MVDRRPREIPTQFKQPPLPLPTPRALLQLAEKELMHSQPTSPKMLTLPQKSASSDLLPATPNTHTIFQSTPPVRPSHTNPTAARENLTLTTQANSSPLISWKVTRTLPIFTIAEDVHHLPMWSTKWALRVCEHAGFGMLGMRSDEGESLS